jgi:hypothetical protein
MERRGTPYRRRRDRGRSSEDACIEHVEGVCQMEIEIVESASDSLGTEVTHVP